MTPAQELFDAVFIKCQDLGFDTYDGLPLKEVPYPFVVISEVQLDRLNWKTALGARLSIDVDIWGDSQMLSQVNEIPNKVLNFNQLKGENLIFVQTIGSSNYRLIKDTSIENTLLNHGIVSLEFRLA